MHHAAALIHRGRVVGLTENQPYRHAEARVIKQGGEASKGANVGTRDQV
jgi:hypothetical protein